MKKIQTKTFEIITSKVKETAVTFDSKVKVVLFGSRANGKYRKDSDWDFLILTERAVNESLKREMRKHLFDTELETNQCISSLIENITEWEELKNTDIFQNIVEEGIEI